MTQQQPTQPQVPEQQQVPATTVISFYLAMVLVAVIWAGFTEPGLALLVRAPVSRAVPWWAAGLGAGLGLVVVTAALEPLMPSLKRLSVEIAQIIAPITPPRIVVLALTSGIAEEMLFRGPVQHSLGYVITSVIFALLHGGVSQRYIAWSTFALLAGLLFGLLAESYQSVWPCVIAHVVVNGINLARLARVLPTAGDGEPQ